MTRKILIRNCGQCQHRDHSGSYTQGGAIPLCRAIGGKGRVVSGVARGGGNWPDKFSSVLPFEAVLTASGRPCRRATNVIPDWCPLTKDTE
jgi:hypothetical protein